MYLLIALSLIAFASGLFLWSRASKYDKQAVLIMRLNHAIENRGKQ